MSQPATKQEAERWIGSSNESEARDRERQGIEDSVNECRVTRAALHILQDSIPSTIVQFRLAVKMNYNYFDTFILVAADCPVTEGTNPLSKRQEPTIAEIEYSLLCERPYYWTQEELLFEVHLRRSGNQPPSKSRRNVLKAEFYEKSRACLRASPLPKRFGWGFHFDGDGRIALCAMESKEYQTFAQGRRNVVNTLSAMRNKRA